MSTLAPDVLRFIERLPELSATDRDAIAARLKFLNGSSRTVDSPSSLSSDWLLDGIVHELKRRQLIYDKVTVKLINKIAPNYFNHSLALRTWLIQSLGKLAPPEQIKLGRMVAIALASYLSNIRQVSLKMMLQNVNKTPEAFDAAFPGYLASGILLKVVTRKAS